METPAIASAITYLKTPRSMAPSGALPARYITRYMVETTAPAAIGTGRPTKSLLWPSFRGAAAMQLNRARRSAAHSRYRMPMPQPTSGGDSWNRTALATSSAGAMPKETISARESNSRPNGPSCPRMRAIRPSNKSNKHAAKIKKVAF